MRKLPLAFAAMLLAAALAGCGPSAAETRDDEMEENAVPEQETKEENTMKITIGEYEFSVSLEANDTAAALKEHLPMTLDMSELNGNEKYNYLPFSLPTDSSCPGNIRAGDVMLYGRECIVVFYKSFSTSYSYTKIGHIDDVTQLQNAVGAGSVQMIFDF